MTHDEKIQAIAAQLKAESTNSGYLSLKKDTVSHMVPNPNDPKHHDRKVNVRDLKDILSIDVEKKICIAEPGVPFCTLVDATLKHALIPYLVPELKTITIGGAVSGCSVESLSYQYGGFHDTCLAYDVITATGEVLECTPEKNADIFHAMHGSYGTLGIISKLTFRLMDAKPYVRMDYIPYPSFKELIAAMRTHIEKGNVQFMDAIVHAPDKAVLCLGTMVDTAPYVNTYTFLKIFYKSTATRTQDYLTTQEYLFRYDTECHWLTKTLPGMETKLMRFLFGKWLLSSTKLLTWSKRLAPILRFDKRPDVVVDVFIPSNTLEKFYALYEEKIHFYPLWVVPYRRVQDYPWIDDDYNRRINDPFFFDLAIYGLKNRKQEVNYYKLIEEWVYDCNGIKTLISHNFYDRDRFWKIYNRKNFDKVKAITDPNNRFRDLYDKFHFGKV